MLRDRLGLQPFGTSGRLWLVLANPESRCVNASHIILRGREALRGGESVKTDGLGGVPPDAAAALADHPQVILTTCIAGFRIGLAGLVCRPNITALFGGFGASKIGGGGPNCQH